MKIIEHRAAYTETFLKKNKKGENLWIKWKDVEFGEYTGAGNPQATINKVRAHDFKLKSLHALIKKDTPLIATPCMMVYQTGTVLAKSRERSIYSSYEAETHKKSSKKLVHQPTNMVQLGEIY